MWIERWIIIINYTESYVLTSFTKPRSSKPKTTYRLYNFLQQPVNICTPIQEFVRHKCVYEIQILTLNYVTNSHQSLFSNNQFILYPQIFFWFCVIQGFLCFPRLNVTRFYSKYNIILGKVSYAACVPDELKCK